MYNGNCIPSDTSLLDNFMVSPTFRRFKSIIHVWWKPPTSNWVKANTDGSVLDHRASCGDIFRDHRGTFIGCFASNLGTISVFEAKLNGVLTTMEFAARNNWCSLWLKSDSTSAVQAFKNSDIIPFCLRDRWHDCLHLDILICSHIFREGNCCVDKLVVHGHTITASQASFG